jgi:predicted DNA-binding transcriptional regulator AlpA
MRKSTPKRTTALARSVAQPLIVLRDATDRFIDDHELQLITGLSKREIARREADAGDIFPKGFLLGPHTKRWSLREVEAWQRHVRFERVRPDNPYAKAKVPPRRAAGIDQIQREGHQIQGCEKHRAPAAGGEVTYAAKSVLTERTP